MPNTEPKTAALALVHRKSVKRQLAENDELLAMRTAQAAGVSLRDIADAAGRTKDTVDRMLKREAG